MKKALFLLLNLISLSLFAQDNYEDKFIPVSILEQIVVEHDYYSYGYDTQHNITAWVAYNLNIHEIDGKVDRSDDFINDPALRVPNQATLATYYRSGYDRGHLAPAADMSFSERAMEQSFFLTNVVPQHPNLNRGLWSALEQSIRQQLNTDNNLYIITGTIFVSGDKKLNQVTVPDYLYKIIFAHESPEQRMIAFMFPNAEVEGDLKDYLVTVDQLEGLSNYDFFYELNDALAAELESQIKTEGWFVDESNYGATDFNGEAQSNYPQSTTPSTSQQSGNSQSTYSNTETTRCLGTAKSTGERCKLYTHNSNGYCHLHQNQVGKSINTDQSYSVTGRCAVITQKGTRCKRSAASGSAYCWQH